MPTRTNTEAAADMAADPEVEAADCVCRFAFAMFSSPAETLSPFMVRD
jgi:hypothetical protein